MAVREALSAQLDGEQQMLRDDEVGAHCETCSECQWWQTQAHSLHRQVRVAPAKAVPNLTPAIMESLAEVPLPVATRQRTLQICRVLLACCAALQFIMTLPMLFGTATGPVHIDHELGSWDLALSAGLLFAAFRPERAWGMLPLVGAVAIALGITGVVDAATGHTNLGAESTHLLEGIGVIFLWKLARLTKHDQPQAAQTHIQLA